MFDDLRSAFREALDNFRTELDRDHVPEQVDRLLKGMIAEVTDARAHLSDLEQQREKAGERLTQEEAAVATCERREAMAREIGDEETARVAAQYAQRHRERVEVLSGKITALDSEIAMMHRDVAEMTEKLKEARTSRSSLAAEAGRTTTRESLRETDRLFSEFDRMEERLGDDGHRATAAEELYADLAGQSRSEMHIDLDEPTRRPEVDFDAALEELKRRMKDAGS